MSPLPGDYHMWHFLLPTFPLPSPQPCSSSSPAGRRAQQIPVLELPREDGKMGQKWGFWEVFLSFPTPHWKKSGFASLFSSFSPSGCKPTPGRARSSSQLIYQPGLREEPKSCGTAMGSSFACGFRAPWKRQDDPCAHRRFLCSPPTKHHQDLGTCSSWECLGQTKSSTKAMAGSSTSCAQNSKILWKISSSALCPVHP